MSNASKGSQREHAVKRLLENDGWAVTRGAGSHGCADLWAARRLQTSTRIVAGTRLKLIQVKANTGNAYKNFSPANRVELLSLAAQTGGEAWLVHWPPRGECRWIAAADWPS